MLVSIVVSGSALTAGTAHAAETGCFTTDLTVERWEDGRGVVVFTTTEGQEAAATAAGFAPTGDAFAASSEQTPGLLPLYDAYRPAAQDHAWILWASEYNSAVAAGWEGRGPIGWVSSRSLADCDSQVQMTRAVKGSLHTVAVGQTEATRVTDAGYALEYSWFAPSAPSRFAEPAPPAPPTNGDGDGSFTVATIPDTQNEVYASSNTRFRDRSEWLVAQQAGLDLRFVIHTGDVVSWDTDTHDQYVRAETALDPLEDAGIPYQLSIGNHDTWAVGVGGSARDPLRTYEYLRETTTFNQFWSAADYSAVAGAFESGKVDNTYSTFAAEGARWLVLNLELWPRLGAVNWAENVIATHAGHNVIIQTHSFLNSAADIDGAGQSSTRWQYGDASPQYVYDRLVAPYGNVKVVTSGHVGLAASKVITTARGNHVAYLLQAIHSNTNNPVRLSEFDVADGTISTRVLAPSDGTTWDSNTLTGLTFIRS
ncbi:metallophosphoesterase [Microbacterium hibisci]|uniref:metallophosphoesterase n=1 Tax=Microbacterium hibisci TaxID=2036000 RepID=UPI0019437306|nr:metallophosphoesterase [Microbacterium hibisci]